MSYFKNKALGLASTGLRWTDDNMERFANLESLPEPLNCRQGCHYCCYNQPMVTPPEALFIGHHVEQTFSDKDQKELIVKIKKILKTTNGKKPDEIAMMRHDLPCIFLQDGMCMVYKVRPAVCRTCCSTSADHCKSIFESRNHRARLRCYEQVREILKTVHLHLVDRCRKMGCQSDFLYIAEAIGDYLKHPNPIEAWLQGEKIFHKRLGLRS